MGVNFQTGASPSGVSPGGNQSVPGGLGGPGSPMSDGIGAGMAGSPGQAPITQPGMPQPGAGQPIGQVGQPLGGPAMQPEPAMGPQGGPGMIPPGYRSGPAPVQVPGSAAAGAVPGAPAQAPSQQAMVDVLEYAREKGYQLPFRESEDALEALLSAYGQMHQMNPYIQIGQQVAPHYDKFTAWLQSQGQAVQPGASAEPKLWDAPEFDPQWLTMVAEDSQGNVIPRPGQSPEIAAKVQRFLSWSHQKARQMVHDPVSTLGPVIEHLAGKKAQEIVQQQVGALRNQAVWDNFTAQNERWLVQHDAQGRPVLDRMRGGLMLTEDGQAFLGFLNESTNLGVTDPQRQIQYATNQLKAMQILRQQAGQQPGQRINGNLSVGAGLAGGFGVPGVPGQIVQQHAAQVPQTAFDHRFEFLRQQAMGQPQHTGSSSPQAGPQNPLVDPRAQLLAQLQQLYPSDAMFRQAVSSEV